MNVKLRANQKAAPFAQKKGGGKVRPGESFDFEVLTLVGGEDPPRWADPDPDAPKPTIAEHAASALEDETLFIHWVTGWLRGMQVGIPDLEAHVMRIPSPSGGWEWMTFEHIACQPLLTGSLVAQAVRGMGRGGAHISILRKQLVTEALGYLRRDFDALAVRNAGSVRRATVSLLMSSAQALEEGRRILAGDPNTSGRIPSELAGWEGIGPVAHSLAVRAAQWLGLPMESIPPCPVGCRGPGELATYHALLERALDGVAGQGLAPPSEGEVPHPAHDLHGRTDLWPQVGTWTYRILKTLIRLSPDWATVSVVAHKLKATPTSRSVAIGLKELFKRLPPKDGSGRGLGWVERRRDGRTYEYRWVPIGREVGDDAEH